MSYFILEETKAQQEAAYRQIVDMLYRPKNPWLIPTKHVDLLAKEDKERIESEVKKYYGIT